MDVVNYKELQAQRDLQACGLTEDSINAIRATTVVNHNGAQHVVPNSQAGNFIQPQEQSTNIQAASEQPSSQVASLQAQLQEQQRMFSRFKQFTDQRLTSLERQLASALETIKNMSNRLTTVASNQQARAALSSSQESDGRVQATPQQQSSQKAPSSQPIDRNGVAPESVQIDKIFYYGNR